MDRTEAMLVQIIRLLTEVRDELRVSNRIVKKEAEQKISESKTKQRQMRKQMMLVENSKGNA